MNTTMCHGQQVQGNFQAALHHLYKPTATRINLNSFNPRDLGEPQQHTPTQVAGNDIVNITESQLLHDYCMKQSKQSSTITPCQTMALINIQFTKDRRWYGTVWYVV